MNTFTDNMATHCVGRFLIDAPQQATKPGGSYELQIATLETHTASQLNSTSLLASVDALLAQRVAYLQSPSGPLDPKKKFFALYQPQPNVRSIRYGIDGDIDMDGYVVIDGRIFLLKTSAIGEARTQLFNNFLVEVAPTLRARQPMEIPSGPGACFDGGLTTMNPTKGENVSWSWHLNGHPDVRFGISTRSNDSKVKPGILDREASAMAVLGSAASEMRSLRKRRFEIAGMKAQEWSVAFLGDQPTYNLNIEIPGLPNSNAAPSIEIEMNVGGHMKGGYVPPSLTEGEALALWDALVKTLRLRPGSL